jgi:hypothetical protein
MTQFFFLIIPRPPNSTLKESSAASNVYKRQKNVLIATGRVDPSCGEPDFNAVCELVPL